MLNRVVKLLVGYNTIDKRDPNAGNIRVAISSAVLAMQSDSPDGSTRSVRKSDSTIALFLTDLGLFRVCPAVCMGLGDSLSNAATHRSVCLSVCLSVPCPCSKRCILGLYLLQRTPTMEVGPTDQRSSTAVEIHGKNGNGKKGN